MPTIYELFGVAPDADTDAIKHAYRRMVREVHPDRFGGRSPTEQTAAAERFRLLTDAWSIVRDPSCGTLTMRSYPRQARILMPDQPVHLDLLDQESVDSVGPRQPLRVLSGK
jgi:DnaJ-domain-containing protein 1